MTSLLFSSFSWTYFRNVSTNLVSMTKKRSECSKSQRNWVKRSCTEPLTLLMKTFNRPTKLWDWNRTFKNKYRIHNKLLKARRLNNCVMEIWLALFYFPWKAYIILEILFQTDSFIKMCNLPGAQISVELSESSS